MNLYVAIAIGTGIWGAVFIMLLIAVAVETDVSRRWNEQWAIDWERRTQRPVDDLLDRLTRQVNGWRKARAIVFWYLIVVVLLEAGFALAQFKMAMLSPTGARTVFLTGGAIIGFMLLPLVVACEIGLNLVESMKRHLRSALGEKLVIHSRQELREIPRPQKKKKDKPAGK